MQRPMRARGSSAAYFAYALSCTHFRWERGCFVWICVGFGLGFLRHKKLLDNCITFLDGCLSSVRPPLQDTVEALKSGKI